jgi:CMP-N,N'-diacetyllegionaminic acid synthase
VSNLKITAIIPARGGSKRLKEKNIYPVWDKPMIYWAIKACAESKHAIVPWVTTDSQKIADVSKALGAKVVLRDEEVSNDKAFKQAAIRDAALKIDSFVGQSDVYISLQANSPQITHQILDEAIDVLFTYNRDEIISVDFNGMQNGAFRIFRGQYVFQKDLSTNCGFYACDLYDVHTEDDVRYLERMRK